MSPVPEAQARGLRVIDQPRAAAAVPRVGVVLAAGRSERLHEVTGGGSKALVKLGGLTLVERAVRTLLHHGVEQVLVVVGYHAGTVAAVISRIAPGRVRAVHAEEWEKGNGASLLAVSHALAGESLFALVTTDHVFEEDPLQALLTTGEPAVLVDPAPHPDAWGEGTRARVHKDSATAFGKRLRSPGIDCGAFLLPPEIFDCLGKTAAGGDATLSGGLTRLAQKRPLKAVLLPEGSWWQDVDSPADLKRARIQLRRSLTKRSDGPVSRYLNRPISTRMSMAVASARISPDLLSVLAFAVGLVAAMYLAQGVGILGAVLVQIASILDGVDGEVARLTVRSSPRGALLDGVLDRVADAAILAAVGVWTLGDGLAPGVVIVFSVAATAGSMLSMAIKDRTAALGLPKVSERLFGFLLAGRDGRLFVVALTAFVGTPFPALVVVAASTTLAATMRVWLVRRSAQRPIV